MLSMFPGLSYGIHEAAAAAHLPSGHTSLRPQVSAFSGRRCEVQSRLAASWLLFNCSTSATTPVSPHSRAKGSLTAKHTKHARHVVLMATYFGDKPPWRSLQHFLSCLPPNYYYLKPAHGIHEFLTAHDLSKRIQDDKCMTARVVMTRTKLQARLKLSPR